MNTTLAPDRPEQLSLFPAAAPRQEASSQPLSSPIPVHLSLGDVRLTRPVWAALAGHLSVRVVGVGDVPAAEATVNVIALTSPQQLDRVQPSSSGSPRTVAVVSDPAGEALGTAVRAGALAAVAEAEIGKRLLPAVMEVGLGGCPILRAAAGREDLAQSILASLLHAQECRVHTAPERPILSRHEAEILAAIAQGNSSREIAGRFSLGVQTVKNHVGEVLRKTEASNPAHAVAMACTRGWLLPPPPPDLVRTRPISTPAPASAGGRRHATKSVAVLPLCYNHPAHSGPARPRGFSASNAGSPLRRSGWPGIFAPQASAPLQARQPNK